MGAKFLHDLDVAGEVKGTSLDINGAADISGNANFQGDLTVAGKITQAGVIDREEWGRTYTVNVNAPLPLLTDDGSSLPTGGGYRMTGHISGTGTEQVSVAVFWNENGTWYINKTFEGGTGSNHVEFKILNSVPTVTLEAHESNYNVHVVHERLSLDEGAGNDNLRGYFGSDSYLSWLESTNTLTVPGDVTVSGGDLILGGTGRIQGIDSVISGTDATNKTYVDTKMPKSGGAFTGAVTTNSTITASGKITGAELEGTSLDINGAADIAGNLNVRKYLQSAHGIPTTNLGAPTVTEMALFDNQFGPKTTLANDYNDLSDLTFWSQATSGASWVEVTSYSDDQKRKFLRTNNSSIIIPNGVYKFRVEFVGKGYTYANAMTGYWSSQSHNTQIQVYKYNVLNTAWTQHTSSSTTVSSWPGHLYLPFGTIPWHETHTTSASHYKSVRIEFTPNWIAYGGSGTDYSGNDIKLYGMQIWGGYPTGRKTVHSYDQNGKLNLFGDINVPGALTLGTVLAAAEGGTGLTDISTLLNANVNLGTLGAAAASHTHTFASLTSKPSTISGYGISDALVIGTSGTTAMAGNTAIPSISGLATTSYVDTAETDAISTAGTNADARYPRGITKVWESVVSDPGTDAWYKLFRVEDSNSNPVECHLKGYAHTAISFIVSEGYQGGGAHINVLDACVSSNNGGYKFIQGLRINSLGDVEVELNSGSNVSIEITVIGDAVVPATLAVTAVSNPVIKDSVTSLVNGMVRAYGDITSESGKIILNGTGQITGIDTVSNSTDAASKAYVDGAVIANTDAQALSISGQTLSLTNSADVTLPTQTTVSGNAGTVTNGVYTTSSVTALSDVTSVGSGAIITAAERAVIGNTTNTNSGDNIVTDSTSTTSSTTVASATAVKSAYDRGSAGISDAATAQATANAAAPKASPTFTGTVAIPNITNVETAITANTNKISYNNTASTKLGTIETNADVTDTTNVAAAGALMASEVSTNIQTFVLPANTTISTYGKSLVDDADAAAARATLGCASAAEGAYGESAYNSISTNSPNWDTAYTDRNKWDGGSTGLTAATGRTSLGLGTAATTASTDYLPNSTTTISGAQASAIIANTLKPTLIDEDDMSSNSAIQVPSQQSVKAYVDASGATVTFANNAAVVLGTATDEAISPDALRDAAWNRTFAQPANTTGEHQGDIVYFGGNNTMDQGELYVFYGTGNWVKAQADTANSARSKGLLGLAIGTNLTDGILLRGMFTPKSPVGSADEGLPLYISNITAGSVTSVVPTTSGHTVRLIGYRLAASTNQIWFSPDNTFVEIA